MSRKSIGGRASFGGGDTQELRVAKKDGASGEGGGSYVFPKMNTREILETLHYIDIKLSQKEFQEIDQHKDLYRQVLERLTIELNGVSAEQINQPEFAGLSQLEHPDLHEESVPNVNSFRLVGNLMKICGVDDFSIRDYIAPDHKRFKKQLSGIINYARHSQEIADELREMTDARDDSIARLEHLQKENERLATELSGLREASKEETKLIAEKEDEVKKLQGDLNSKNDALEVFQDEIRQLKDFNSSLKEGLAKRTAQVEDALDTKKKLQSQIVSSPGRFKKQLEDSNWNLEQEEKDAKISEKKVHDFTKWIESIEKHNGVVTSALDAMEGVKKEVDNQGELKKAVDESSARISEKRHALVALDQNVQQVVRAGVRADEKLQHLRKQSKAKNQDATGAIEDLHRQIIEAENHKMHIKKKCEDSESAVSQVEREAESEKLRMEQEKKDITQAFQRLERSVVPFLRNIRSAVTEENDPLNQSIAYV